MKSKIVLFLLIPSEVIWRHKTETKKNYKKNIRNLIFINAV